jgi:perosamine synthetase
MATCPVTSPELAINGGVPVRAKLLSYGQQTITDEDVQAVVEVLRSDWLTTGPKIAEFEEAFAAYVGASYAVSFSSGTAALHGATFAAGLQPGEEAITTPLTFAATANCVLHVGANPVFADITPDTLNLDPDHSARAISARTRVLMPVDYSGHPAELGAFFELADKHGLVVIEDACHALGALYRGRRVGGIAHMTVFSFHPVKHLTTGEGGMVTTDNLQFAETLRRFRNHGITSDARSRQASGQWFYEMVLLGFNYRLTDMACALGLQQLKRLDENLARRRAIAARYNGALLGLPLILPKVADECVPAWHLYPVRLELERLSVGRAEVFAALRAENIGVNVHYIPVHLHPYYREQFGYCPGDFPKTEQAYEQLISLPMFHGMTDEDVDDVIRAVGKVLSCYS